MFDINKARNFRENYFLKNMDNMTPEELDRARGQMLANEIELLPYLAQEVNGVRGRICSVPFADSCGMADSALRESIRLMESALHVLQDSKEKWYGDV